MSIIKVQFYMGTHFYGLDEEGLEFTTINDVEEYKKKYCSEEQITQDYMEHQMSLFIMNTLLGCNADADENVKWLIANMPNIDIKRNDAILRRMNCFESFIGDMLLEISSFDFGDRYVYGDEKRKEVFELHNCTYTDLMNRVINYCYSTTLFVVERCIEKANYEYAGWQEENGYINKFGLENIINDISKYHVFCGRIYMNYERLLEIFIPIYDEDTYDESYDEFEKETNGKEYYVEFRTIDEWHALQNTNIAKDMLMYYEKK